MIKRENAIGGCFMTKSNTKFLAWDLQEIVSSIVGHYPDISKVYLFGSRSYKTHSYRSDIDIFCFVRTIHKLQSQ